jgi:hypothetical protein
VISKDLEDLPRPQVRAVRSALSLCLVVDGAEADGMVPIIPTVNQRLVALVVEVTCTAAPVPMVLQVKATKVEMVQYTTPQVVVVVLEVLEVTELAQTSVMQTVVQVGLE